MIKDIFDLQDRRFFVIRYVIAIVLFTMYIWPHVVHDITTVESGMGTQFSVLWNDFILNLVIALMFVIYPLANALVVDLLDAYQIVNVRRVVTDAFIKQASRIPNLIKQREHIYKKDGAVPFVKVIGLTLLTGLVTGLIVYWAIVFYLLFGWLILIAYIVMVKKNITLKPR